MKKLSLLLLLIISFSFKIADFQSIYNLPRMSSGVSAADYDLDGDLDIIVNHPQEGQTNWGGTYILANDGVGHFSLYDSIYDTLGWYNKVENVLSGTYPDVVSEARDSLHVLSTDGEKHWINKFHIGPYVSNFDLGDMNMDGNMDVVFYSNVLQFWAIMYNSGEEGFSDPVLFNLDFPPTDINCVDFNNDSRIDIVFGGQYPKILLNFESGFEEILIGIPSLHVSPGDFDRNGNTDIVTMSEIISISKVRFFKNNGNNSLSLVNEFTIPQLCTDILVSDLNLDNFPDLIVQTSAYSEPGGFLIYYNLGNFEFKDVTFIAVDRMGEERRFMACADMDGNGFNDLILSRQVININLDNSPLEILFNDGDGNFVGDPLTLVKELSGYDKIEISCYPNPFNKVCNIELRNKLTKETQVTVYNLEGKKIKNLTRVNSDSNNKIIWNGTDKNGKEVNPGIYIVSLETGGQASSCRVIKNN